MSVQKRKKAATLEPRDSESKRLSLKNQIEFQKQLLLQKNSECSRLIMLNKSYKEELERRKDFEKEDYPQQIINLQKIISKFEEDNDQIKAKYEILNKLYAEQNETISKMKDESFHFTNDVFGLLQDIEKLLQEKNSKILELTNFNERLLASKLEEDKYRQQEEKNDEVMLDRTIQIKKWIYKHPRIKYLVQILWTNRRRQSTN